MPISTAKAKTLCNASEMSLITASMPREIGELSAARLRQKVTRARELRDKWRDQAERQRRAKQEKQAARQTSTANRSAEKAELFAEALARFEKQLAKSPNTEAAVPARKSTPKKTRAKQHRATRAAVRDELEETRQKLTTAGKTARPNAAAQEALAKKPISQPAPANLQADEAQAPADSKGADKKKRSAGAARPRVPKGLTELATAQGLSTNKRKQSRAQTAAKTNRLKISANTRIQKHLSARTKRTQARRDSR